MHAVRYNYDASSSYEISSNVLSDKRIFKKWKVAYQMEIGSIMISIMISHDLLYGIPSVLFVTFHKSSDMDVKMKSCTKSELTLNLK